MNLIRVKLQKFRNQFIFRLPKIIIDRYKLRDGDEIEISIHTKSHAEQSDLWDAEPQDINLISFRIPKDTLSLNMYNRIYVPVEFRFFFPPTAIDFILETNIGNIQTHLTADGFIMKGMRKWLSLNGPLQENDTIKIVSNSDDKSFYELVHTKKNLK